jgi:hypothetical protein
MGKRKLFEKREGFCDACKQRLRPSNKGRIKRFLVSKKVVCISCCWRHYRHGSFVKLKSGKRVLFEKVEGICDYCHKEIKKYENDFRHKVNGLVVCGACYRCYLVTGDLDRKLLGALYRYKRDELKKMSVDELLKFVGYDKERKL